MRYVMGCAQVLLLPRIGKSPVFEAYEGVGCVSGAADGPIAMAAALVAVGGPAAPAGQAVVRANVAHMVVSHSRFTNHDDGSSAAPRLCVGCGVGSRMTCVNLRQCSSFEFLALHGKWKYMSTFLSEE